MIARFLFGNINIYIWRFLKKNGKSELANGLGVYHLFADRETNGEVYIVAADRDNAGIVFNVFKRMVERSPALSQRSRIVDSTKQSTIK